MLILDRDHWPKHFKWAVFTAAATAGRERQRWYMAYGFSSGTWRWPGGSSPPGLTFGGSGFDHRLLKCCSVRASHCGQAAPRIGRTKTWMMAHIWLGLLTFPLLMLHGRFHFMLGTSTLAAVLHVGARRRDRQRLLGAGCAEHCAKGDAGAGFRQEDNPRADRPHTRKVCGRGRSTRLSDLWLPG